ncbi:piwi-like protein Ago3 [Leptidea sinapis]|uniref:piwi-like protein Ago3 n=1 Tax=Leptidea sinapis TaxID=189913 RepID=UPI002128831F|nr:piwi-like protein Ago3 [Leptidea sinapis]
MDNAPKGRGRGLALIKEILARRSANEQGSPGSSEPPTAAPSVVGSYAPSEVGSYAPSEVGSYAPSEVPSLLGSYSSSESPSVAPTVVGSASCMSTISIGGRGKIAALMSKMKEPKPGSGDAPLTCPASDVRPTTSTSMGRGMSLLKNLQMTQSSQSVGAAQSSVDKITQDLAASSIVSETTSTPKNKYFREVKETPPVVMKGVSGTPYEVTANFIYLNFEENFVFEYEVRYEPDQDHRHLRFKLLQEHKHLFKEKTFDGTTLYVPHKLPEDINKLVSTNPYDESKVNITIIFRRTRRLSEMIHIYNVLFMNIMRDLELVRFGRQHFSQQGAVLIPQYKLEVWPGYVTAVDEYEGGLMLTLDSTHRVLRTETVLSFIKEHFASAGANWGRIVTEKLLGCSVMTNYNKRLFRIDHIDLTMTPKSTFEKKVDGETVKISYIDYYKKNYGIDIMDWDQPMLISKETKRISGSEKPVEYMICLVPELCQLTGLSDDQRSNFRLMKEVATYTRITPNQRHAAFKKYIDNVMKNESARNRLKNWGLSIAPDTINIMARGLAPEPVLFGNNVKVPGKPNADWSFEACKNAVIHAVDLLSWAVVYTDRDKQCTMNFIETIRRCGNPMGITISQPTLVRLPNDRIDTCAVTLKKIIHSQLQIVVVICSTKTDDRYSSIKKICCAENPIPSQVINARTIMNQQKLRSITQKILLQINCKLGGTLWGISIPFKTAMVIGIDCYHDPSRRLRSVCSFVASYNQSMTTWYSKAVFQEKGQEIIDSLKACLVDALKHYLRVNGRLPDRIIMYRDGVGDGQLKLLRDYEVPQLQICFKSLGDTDYKPTLTYVVVQKRINTRIFSKTGNGFDNPIPGTVVDHAITRRDWYDFLIVSQKVNQGTVTPTHYVVVHDSSGLTPDQCQRLTYKLCHLYYNWPGTVRVPAPCQYAHKLAYLIGQNVKQPASEILADKLFFL